MDPVCPSPNAESHQVLAVTHDPIFGAPNFLKVQLPASRVNNQNMIHSAHSHLSCLWTFIKHLWWALVGIHGITCRTLFTISLRRWMRTSVPVKLWCRINCTSRLLRASKCVCPAMSARPLQRILICRGTSTQNTKDYIYEACSEVCLQKIQTQTQHSYTCSLLLKECNKYTDMIKPKTCLSFLQPFPTLQVTCFPCGEKGWLQWAGLIGWCKSICNDCMMLMHLP